MDSIVRGAVAATERSNEQMVLAVRPTKLRGECLDRLDGFQRFVERTVELAILRDAAPQDRLEIGEVRDVDDLINALHERAHCVVCGEAMAQEHDEMLAPFGSRTLDQLAEDRIILRGRSFEVLVNDHDIVAVSLELQDDIFLEQTEVHLVGHVDQLRHDHFLVLLVIDADERGVIAEIEKR